MAAQENDGWRRAGGARCVSMTEVSLTLSVILGLAFVSVRVMKMEGPLPGRHGPAVETAVVPGAAPSSDPAPSFDAVP